MRLRPNHRPAGVPALSDPSNVHPHAQAAAELAESAGTQRARFWEMHDWLFDNQQALDTTTRC